MVDHYGSKNALDLNMKLEFQRNRERYEFMKWGMQAFDTFGVVPPGFGIVHQVNLEYLARGVHEASATARSYYPDTAGRHRQPHHHDQRHRRGRLGRGRHRGRGRHARPAGVLPDAGRGRRCTSPAQLREGVTATDLVLRGHRDAAPGTRWWASSSSSSAKARPTWPCRTAPPSPTWRPEYGATMGFFPVDETHHRLLQRHRPHQGEIEAFEAYFKAQGLFGVPRRHDAASSRHAYTRVVELDLRDVTPSLAGPKRPQDRIELGHVVAKPSPSCSASRRSGNGFSTAAADPARPVPALQAATTRRWQASTPLLVQNGDVLIAAITSCTNTIQPQRAAGRRPAGQEGGQGRADGGAAHQDHAWPRARAS